jgi:ubiquinone/menaquinone biosynthesis C-methylase UbiE
MRLVQQDWEAAMTLETDVAQHYSTGGLLGRIDEALRKAGADPDTPSFDDLKPVDEFHTAGLEATAALLDQLEIAPGAVVFDLGCGIGGTARHLVHRYGASVQGVDLTAEYVETARALNARLGLGDAVTLHEGSVLDLPWKDESADLVTMFHVGMNIADKAALFVEVARVLKPGGRFALFDVMQDENADDLVFPLPWAGRAEISHVEAPDVYRRAAHAAGLEQVAERDRTAFAAQYFDRVFRMMAANGVPPLGIHLLMSGDPGEKLRNYVANLSAGRIAPTEMIFGKPA